MMFLTEAKSGVLNAQSVHVVLHLDCLLHAHWSRSSSHSTRDLSYACTFISASQLRFLASLQEAWPHCSRVPFRCGDARWAVGVGSQLPLCRGGGCPGCCCSHCCALVPRCLLNAGPTATFLILYSIASPASLVFI